ncbi:MAG TPA: hypothetical protein VGR90_02840 [Acidimicrobiales bacterium]|nr:hypothetical protein [Acidimicrobiales bacterium]
MNQLLRRHAKVAVAAGLAAAVLSGGAAAYALGGPSAAAGAQGSGQTGANSQGSGPGGATTPAAKANKPDSAKALAHVVFGNVVSTATTGGAVKNAGTITLKVPNNPNLVINLAPATRVFAYNGPGKAPTKESIGDVKANDNVAVYVMMRRPKNGSGAGNSTGTPVAAEILDLGTF